MSAVEGRPGAHPTFFDAMIHFKQPAHDTLHRLRVLVIVA